MREPLVSVVIPTFNRAELLRPSLESLIGQSVPRDRYEVIVVDDGSTDATPQVCRDLSGDLPLRYARLGHSGIAAAKNLGLFCSTGRITLFFDDDDVASPNLLEEHLEAHAANPQDNVAVLGHTAWAPSLRVTELMYYVTGPGALLFSYGNLTHAQVLDFTYFWGGRSSCKRSLLVTHGVFNQNFLSIIEDIELGYRLSRFGLKVVYDAHAVSYMNRPLSYDEFCRRCERQGWSLLLFSRLHPEPRVQQYCGVRDAELRWREMKGLLEERVGRAHQLEAALEAADSQDRRGQIVEELHSLYRWTFNAFRTRGIVHAMRAHTASFLRMSEMERLWAELSSETVPAPQHAAAGSGSEPMSDG